MDRFGSTGRTDGPSEEKISESSGQKQDLLLLALRATSDDDDDDYDNNEVPVHPLAALQIGCRMERKSIKNGNLGKSCCYCRAIMG